MSGARTGTSVLVCLWSVKGGVGTSVVAGAAAVRWACDAPEGALVVDLAGDLPAVLGTPDPEGPGVLDWTAADDVPADALTRLEHAVGDSLALLSRGGEPGVLPRLERCHDLAALLACGARSVIVDCGRVDRPDPDPVAAALLSVADRSVLVTTACYLALRRVERGPRPTGVVVVREPGRALDRVDVEAVVGAPVIAQVPWDPAIARSVDAGLLVRRLPRALARLGGALR